MVGRRQTHIIYIVFYRRTLSLEFGLLLTPVSTAAVAIPIASVLSFAAVSTRVSMIFRIVCFVNGDILLVFGTLVGHLDLIQLGLFLWGQTTDVLGGSPAGFASVVG